LLHSFFFAQLLIVTYGICLCTLGFMAALIWATCSSDKFNFAFHLLQALLPAWLHISLSVASLFFAI
jgi:hypothetical protein